MTREKFVIEIENDTPFTDNEIIQLKNFISKRMQGGYSTERPSFLKGSMFLSYELHPTRVRNEKLKELGI